MICLALKLFAQEGRARLFPGALKGDGDDRKGLFESELVETAR